MLAAFQEVYAYLPDNQRLLMEYKFFEPAWYHTDLADWGAASLFCKKLGPKATVLVDTGHHPQGTNIEWIVASLLDEGLLGGFHFNSRKYADDDLTVGSVNPHELFLIYNELVDAEDEGQATVAGRCANRVAYMFDQCHAYKNTIEATIQSAMNVQEAYAKALLVDRAALKAARLACDVSGAEEILKDAYQTDVRPILRELRESMGLDPEPLKAFRRSGYTEKIVAARAKTHAARAAGSAF
jgi:L-rhamnose isomerase/sugar isomerase